MKDILKSIVYLIIGIIIFGGLWYSQIRDEQKLNENGIHTTGEIIGTYQGKPKWAYRNNNGNIIEIKSSTVESLIGFQKGEKFKAVYDPGYSKNAEILFEYPIIEENSFDTLYNYNILNINDNYTLFQYQINNKKVKREQKIPKNEKWKINDEYILLVSIENNNIAYLKPAPK